MYQSFYLTDVHRNIKSYLVFNCIISLFVCLILSVLVLALLPLYLPFHNFIPANLDNNSIIPTRLNTSTVFIDEKNWPIVEETIQNLFNLKLNNIQFTTISDIRIVDSIPSKRVLTTWCNPNGCLRVLGKIQFSIDCPLACQLHKMNKIERLNSIDPPKKINLNSTLNINYIIELDAFVVIAENEENGDPIKIYLLYNLMENQARTLSSMSVSVDNSSLVNITHLVTNSIIQSHMNISEFVVIQADVNMELLILNVTVLFRFNIKCMIDCQDMQINKLKNTTLVILDPIFIIYNGRNHFHNVSLTGVFVDTSMIIPENTMIPDNRTIETTSLPIIYLRESIFEVIYKLESFDLIIEGDLELGPIINYTTLFDLTNMMQTTASNYSNITVFVFNATIEIDNENSTTKSPSFNSIDYILRLIVYYFYPITCDECIEISNNAVYSKPQFNKLIQIRNATLIDISSPIIVIDITPYPTTTTSLLSNYTVSISTTDSNDKHSTDVNDTIKTTSQYQITDHTKTTFHSTEHTTLHTTEHTSHHTSTHPHTSSHSRMVK